MSRKAARGRESQTERALHAYWQDSKRPIQILGFLLPLVVLYELAMVSILRSEQDQTTYTNQAHKALLDFFDAFGIEASGWYLPGAALVVVLLVWQLLVRERWEIRLPTLGVMAAEAVVLSIPLLVLGQLLARLVIDDGGAAAATNSTSMLQGAGSDLATLSSPARIAISIGAGIYEELVFRMLVIAVLHAVLVDVAKLSEAVGVTIAVLVSAALFTIYHWYGRDASTIPLSLNLFYFLAGAYFGVVYVLRGFGIVVAVHGLYDVATALMLPTAQ